MIDISSYNKGEVLAALYNNSKPLGMGFLHFDPKPMTIREGNAILETQTAFDYHKGRVMKVDLSEDQLDERLYDRDNGIGAAAKVISQLQPITIKKNPED